MPLLLQLCGGRTTSLKRKETCGRCGLIAQKHDVIYLSDARKTNEILLNIFCAIRNLRFALSNKSVCSIDKQILESKFIQFRRLPIHTLRGKDFISTLNTVRNLTLNMLYDDLISTLCSLDEIYFRIYYEANLDVPHNLQERSVIPSPHEYFSDLIDDVNVLNSSLGEYITTAFSEEYRALISRVWGLRPSGGPEPPFHQNPLLAYHFGRWRETIHLFNSSPLNSWSAASDPQTLVQQCSLSATMKPSLSVHASMKLPGDPLLPPAHRKWADNCRVWACHLYAYATPNPEAINKLLSLSPMVEVGAGTGYWAHMIREAHKKTIREQSGALTSLARTSEVIYAYDRDPPSCAPSSRMNAYHGRASPWTAVMKGGPAEAIAGAYASLRNISLANNRRSSVSPPSLSLLLCYPPPDSDMALQSMKIYMEAGGTTICYVGEKRGDTGTKGFEKLLESSFRCDELIPLPNWMDTCYSLTIWRRLAPSPASSTPSSPLPPYLLCCVCGSAAPLSTARAYRCRVTYAVTFCSCDCAGSAIGRQRHIDELSFRALLYQRAGIPCNDCPMPHSPPGGVSDSPPTPWREKIETRLKPRKISRKRKSLYRDSIVSSAAKRKRNDSDPLLQRINIDPLFSFNTNWYMNLL